MHLVILYPKYQLIEFIQNNEYDPPVKALADTGTGVTRQLQRSRFQEKNRNVLKYYKHFERTLNPKLRYVNKSETIIVRMVTVLAIHCVRF